MDVEAKEAANGKAAAVSRASRRKPSMPWSPRRRNARNGRRRGVYVAWCVTRWSALLIPTRTRATTSARKEASTAKKHGKHSSSDSDSSSSEEERRRRQKEKRDRKREKSKAKREGRIAESRLALQQVAELKKIIEEKEEAEKKAKAAAEAGAMPPPEPKYTIDEVKEIIGLSRTRAKEKTPETTTAHPARNPPKPRTLFEAITCSCEVVISPEPKSNASVDSVATSITTLLREKLELAEKTQSLKLGMGSTSACRAECNKIANQVAKHYTSLEDVESLKAVLVNSNIDSQCKQSNTIISKILEGIATRGVEITSTELHI